MFPSTILFPHLDCDFIGAWSERLKYICSFQKGRERVAGMAGNGGGNLRCRSPLDPITMVGGCWLVRGKWDTVSCVLPSNSLCGHFLLSL